MRIHPRARVFTKARQDLDRTIVDINDRYGLTATEIVAMLLERAHWWQQQIMHEERKSMSWDNTDNTTEHLLESKV
jgi:hypothetical protein